jgi:hypothetical protein
MPDWLCLCPLAPASEIRCHRYHIFYPQCEPASALVSILYWQGNHLIMKHILDQEYVDCGVPPYAKALLLGSYCLIPSAHAPLHESTHTFMPLSTDCADSCIVSGHVHAVWLLDWVRLVCRGYVGHFFKSG